MQEKLDSSTDSEIIPQQKQFKVLLIGDSCIDRYVYGVCERVSPEAPVPVLKRSSEERIKGMSHNVRHNLESFGVDVHMRSNEPYDIIKSRFIDYRYGQQLLRVDIEDPDIGDKLQIEQLPDSSNEYDALIISDYDKGYVSSEVLFYMAEHFDGPVFIDSKKSKLPDFDNVILKINDKEYSKLENKDASNLIVTKGIEGAEYRGNLYPAETVDVLAHVCGAGDTFFAALVYFYLETGSVEEAIPYANKAAAIAVSNFGTYTLTQEDIDEIRR